MNCLCIDTTSNILTVVFVADGRKAVRSLDVGKSGHTAVLLSVTDAVLKEAGTDVSSVDAVALVTGPGSFTGIRIGAATATAFCQATGAKRIAVTAFEILSHGRQDVIAAVEAGHGNLYAAHCTNGSVREDFFLTAEERAQAEKRGEKFLFSPLGPTADVFAEIALRKAERGEFTDVFRPYYMRKSQAERNRDEI